MKSLNEIDDKTGPILFQSNIFLLPLFLYWKLKIQSL